jgi:esterase/lipase
MTILIILFILVILCTVILFGPRVRINMNLRPFDLPKALKDLDEYLKTSEAQYDDILPDTEKIILWADPKKKHKTPVSVISLHGFSATRQETAPLSDLVARELGANLFYTRLAGHGRSSQALGAATVNEWMNDTVEALEIGRLLGERVLVISTSTGGTLSTWLATLVKSDEILAYIMVSPNFLPNHPIAKILTWPWAHTIMPLFYGKTWRWWPGKLQEGQYWTTSYPINVIFQMMALVQFARKADVSKITTPLQVFLSKQDKIVAPEETEKMYDRFGSPVKQKIYIEDAEHSQHHVIAGDILSPNTTERIAGMIVEFVTPLLPEK